MMKVGSRKNTFYILWINLTYSPIFSICERSTSQCVGNVICRNNISSLLPFGDDRKYSTFVWKKLLALQHKYTYTENT